MFNEKEKIEAFNRLEAEFYQRNFGSMSKSDLELLMFDIYIEHLLNNKKPFDDHTMSKELGITQSRIRALKLRKELKYPHEGFEWKASFAETIKNASYDKENRRVKVLISDINVLTELRYFLETNGWYDEYSLNPKLFQCRLDFFLELCSKLSDQEMCLNEDAEKKLQELEKETHSDKEKSAIKKILEGSMEDGLKALVLGASKEILLATLKTIPFGGIASEIVGHLVNTIEKE